MDAIIRVTSSEFNEELFKKIGALVKDRNVDVTIAVHDRGEIVSTDEFWERLKKSVTDIDSGGGVTFSMSELEEFIKK